MKISSLSIKKLLEIILIVFLFYFCVFPIVSVMFYGLSNTEQLVMETTYKRTIGLLSNSLLLAFSTTIISVLLGTIAAFTLHRLNFIGKNLSKILILLPLVDPPFIGALAFIMLFGTRGLITYELLGQSISPFGFHGVLFQQVMGSTIVAYLLVSGSIASSNSEIEDAARNMGASELKILTKITFPLMLPEISTASLLVFLGSLADFATPVVIGGDFRTLASDLYIQIIGVYDMKAASISGIVLLVPCLLAFILQYKIASYKNFSTDVSSVNDIIYQQCPKFIRIFFITITSLTIFVVSVIFIFIFVGAFTSAWGYDYTFTLKHVSQVFNQGFRTYIEPLRNSLVLSLVTGFTTAAFGVALSYRVYYKKIVTPRLVDFICVFPAAIPGILVGMGYLITFKNSLFGIGDIILTSAPRIILLGTVAIVYIICIARQLNISMRSCYAKLKHIEPDIFQAAYNLGASQLYTTFHVLVPLLKDAFMNAFLRVFSNTMITLGAIIFLILPQNKVIVQILFQGISSQPIGISCILGILLSVTTLSVMLLIYVLAYGKELKQKIKIRRLFN